uniref:TSA: Wollemia nobilis Ref_Wollemi_Transcript_18533_2184 transcribed RNA sequence n=1 Tax=Wollemia nobilis TaxID=56998 RepID=A0A0C9S5U4_9CONI
MVSSDSTTEESSSSMDEKEQRFYSRLHPVPVRQPSPSTQSESESKNSEQSSPQQKKPAPTSSVNTIRPPKPSSSPSVPVKSFSSAKRPREQEEEREEEKQQVQEIEPLPKKRKKVDPLKKLSPLDEAKKKSKKMNGDNKKGKNSVLENGELNETKGKAKESDGDNKRRKKSVLESADTPSAQKSVKKTGQIWSPREEVAFLKCVVGYLEGGNEFPKHNLVPLYDHIRSLKVLDNEYSNSQMGDKFRRFRGKFQGMTDKVKGKNFSFKTPHEETLYRLSNKVWGRGVEEDDEEDSGGEEDEEGEEHPVKVEMANGRVEEKSLEDDGEEEGEEEKKKSRVEDIQMTQTENEDDDEEDEENGMSNTKENLAGTVNPNPNSNPRERLSQHHVSTGSMLMVPADDVRKLMDHILEEIHEEKIMMRNKMKEMKDHLHREMEELKSSMEKMVKEEIQGFTRTSYSDDGTSNKYMFSSAEMVKRMSSARDLPPLDASDAQKLEQDWHELHLVELDICSRRLALLQSECQFQREKVRAQVNKPNP